MRNSLLLICFVVSGCASHNISIITKDIKETAYCNTDPIYVSPSDGREDLAAKIIIANSKIDKCDNAQYFTEQKLDKYGDL